MQQRDKTQKDVTDNQLGDQAKLCTSLDAFEMHVEALDQLTTPPSFLII